MQSKKELLALISPSLVGGSIMLCVALLAAFLLIVSAVYQDAQLGFGQYFDALRSGQTDSRWYDHYSTAEAAVNSSKAAADSAVFVAWSVIGLLGYVAVLGLYRFGVSIVQFVRVEAFSREDRKAAAREALVHIVIRMTGIGLLFLLYKACIALLLPLLFMLAGGVLDGPAWLSIALTGLMIVEIFLILHIVVVCLRAIVLRRRVFFTANSFTYR